jgi:uncharacterized protein YqjF (DUF2071 family)
MVTRGRPELTPLPTETVERPLMLQWWKRLTFLHWRYEPRTIARFLPPGLEVDVFEGAAWVGLTPFLAEVRPPLVPAALALRFPETNVRTYARAPDGSTGVWFFSLDASRKVAVVGARLLYHLPYKQADMRVEYTPAGVRYVSARTDPAEPASSDILVEPDEALTPVEAGDLDCFLTARWRLYTVLRQGLGYAPVEHPPWPLARARVLRLEQNLITAAGLPPPQGRPLVHYSHGVEVRVGRPRLL